MRMNLIMISAHHLFKFAVLFVASTMFSMAHAEATTEDKTKQIWQMLDYMSVDYSGAVENGKVINKDEYAEMVEFASAVERQLAELPGKAELSQLLQQTMALKAAIADKAAPAEVGEGARTLASALLAAYPVPLAPANAPDLKRGATLYQAQCASCHGDKGAGDGPLAAKLDPPPIAFTDRERARERSLFSLYQTITLGVEGTSMPAFKTLSEEERWVLAFFASTFAHTDEERQAGEKLLKSDKSAQSAIPTLSVLTQASGASLEKSMPSGHAAAVLAYLKSHPQTLEQSKGKSLALSKARLRESLAAFEKNDRAEASRLALSAYLDGFEPVEPALAIQNKALFAEIEAAMGSYRHAVSQGDVAEARAIESKLQSLLTRSEDALMNVDEDPLGVFVGALTILLREGLEALLIVIAMIAFLKKADRSDVLPYIYAGWVTALAAGGLTWFAATYLVTISGAAREITEGFAAIFAAVVLLSVGIWMHQKSLAGRWQAYVKSKLSSALSKRSAPMLFVLAFVTVYREVFETVLFYAALWTPNNGSYLLAGLGTGIALLAVIAIVMLKTSARLPISRFFAVSSALVAILAVILMGKGIAALQEAGMLGSTPLSIPRIDLLGIYPSLQTISAQLIVLLIIIVSVTFSSRSQKSL